MHVRVVLLPIVVLLFTWAGTTDATDVSFEPHCNHQADLLCPGVSRSSDSWKQWFQSCMQQMRIGCVTNDKCPYPGLNCRCYNGCVQENWRSQKDVGRYCHGQCQMSGDLPNC
ncbi:hypothetical protein V8E36_009876 [Tilletia maclaganii]